ncbi:MAG: Mut7-C RNAse domain-containing protein [Syntrophales bacterium]|nr:Mut7-C RNAse domain-containing protein [Syntrophales bacterium]
MKFIADCMLGKLARWLRLLGLDVKYYHHTDDGEILDLLSRQKDLILLTRDRELFKRAAKLHSPVSRSLLIQSELWEEQIKEVLFAFQLREHLNPFSRCLECNTRLIFISKKEAESSIPPRIAALHHTFLNCPSCGRIFWSGSHYNRMRDKLAELIKYLP